MNARPLNNVGLNYVSYGSEVCVDIGELETFYVVEVPLSGSGAIQCGKQRTEVTPDHASVASPTEPLAQWLSADFAQAILRIERPALEAALSELTDRPVASPLRFTLGMDITREPGRSWHNLLSYCTRSADRGDSLLDHPLIAQQVEQCLLMELLLAQPHNYSDQLDSAAPLAPSRVVSVARELIESHPEWPHTVASIANAAGVSTRTLQRAFQHHLNTSPTRYLRNVRLQRVHDELLAAQPGLTTVKEVANRWGFPQGSRFIVWYRQQFGESPSATLRRSLPRRSIR